MALSAKSDCILFPSRHEEQFEDGLVVQSVIVGLRATKKAQQKHTAQYTAQTLKSKVMIYVLLYFSNLMFFISENKNIGMIDRRISPIMF